jgi:alcohol dehydrogenase
MMALASTYAGLAFTRANVGNVHAIAHQLGGKYHTPHGLANAIMLPHVLRFSARAITDKLATLALRARAGAPTDSRDDLAHKFLDAVDALGRTVGIPTALEALHAADIPALAKAACSEADNNYPVPRVMSPADCEALLRAVLPPADAAMAAHPVTDKPAPMSTRRRRTGTQPAARKAARPKAAGARRPAAKRAARTPPPN